jgi:predicted alpha/beta superfamily hydrolase
MYALLKQTELFNRYVLSSPGANAANRFFFECEEAYAKTHTDMPVTLFITMGELEAGAAR